jgi:hypothetical protein
MQLAAATCCHTLVDVMLLRACTAGQWEYSGATRALAEQVSDAGHGGQVLICETTSQHIHTR